MQSRQGEKGNKWIGKLSSSTLFWFYICSIIALISILIAILLFLSGGLTIVSSIFTIVFLPISYSVMVKTLKESSNNDSDDYLATRTTPQNYKSIINLIPPTNPSIYNGPSFLDREIR